MTTTEISSDTENIIAFPNTVKMKAEYHPTVHDLPTDERPRERLQNHGPQALSNAELLAIILRTGTSRNNVIELAGILLAKFGGLGGLMRADFMELCKEHGLGTAKTAQLFMPHRWFLATLTKKPTMRHAEISLIREMREPRWRERGIRGSHRERCGN